MELTDFYNMTINDLQEEMLKIEQLRRQAEGSSEHHIIHNLERELLRGYFGTLLRMFDQLEFKDIGMNNKLANLLDNLEWKLDHFRREQTVDSTDALIQFAKRRHMLQSIEIVNKSTT